MGKLDISCPESMENSFINGLIPLSTSPSDETKIDELFRAIPSGSILPAAKVNPY